MSILKVSSSVPKRLSAPAERIEKEEGDEKKKKNKMQKRREMMLERDE